MSTLKHKGKGPQALTANGLRTGPVVYLSADYTWNTAFENAMLTEDPLVIARMSEAGDRDEEENLIVGPYFIDVDAETHLPARYRERFRAQGPSYDPGKPTYAELLMKDGAQVIGQQREGN
ncbi:MAG: sulfite reductase [Robiginitomaculum sp.]|nr:MAG: sulfite reductase [Robiginitomaculum sp.]